MLSLKQAAEYLGISTNLLRQLVGRREINFFRVGEHGNFKFRQEWLDEYVEKNTRKAGVVAEMPRRQKGAKPDWVPDEYRNFFL